MSIRRKGWESTGLQSIDLHWHQCLRLSKCPYLIGPAYVFAMDGDKYSEDTRARRAREAGAPAGAGARLY